MSSPQLAAPNGPGSQARWTSSAKTGDGTALSNNGDVWFTLSHGIFTKRPAVRLGLCPRHGLHRYGRADYFCQHLPAWPLPDLEGDCDRAARHAVLQQTRFTAREGTLSDYKLYILLAPHLGNQGKDNTGWLDDLEGTPLLESFANQVGLISEQVWDSPDILLSPRLVWRLNHKIRSVPAGKLLRIETLSPAVIHWAGDDWKTAGDVTTRDFAVSVGPFKLESGADAGQD